MNKERQIDLRKSILEIENPYPKDDLILSYADFLKHRDYLCYYKFNPRVFHNILKITNDEWASSNRINRLSLISILKNYIISNNKDLTRKKILTPETRFLIFELFRKVFEEDNYISVKQIDEARRICNNLLINVNLTPTEEQWLCENIEVSELLLNRVLRYPTKSRIISNWARQNFDMVISRNRRAEITSWIIDEKPNFEIENQTLIDDFEFLNAIDSLTIQKYEEALKSTKKIDNKIDIQAKEKTEITENDEARALLETNPEFRLLNNAIKMIEEKFGPLSLSIRKHINDDLFNQNNELSSFENSETTAPELKLTRRFYEVAMDRAKYYPVSIPDFEKLQIDFYNNLSHYQITTMIWAITYSRLDNTVKSSLLKKYYNNETHNTMFKVCKKTKNMKLLKWMLAQQ
ncbi:MAG: hypothetical protein PHV20_07595 [Bacteroidales bacterium]|nr:hypothetical protein [Bacteroidales bacterium]